VLPASRVLLWTRIPPCRGRLSPPECGKCQKPMAFMTTIPRVTEPGRVRIFQCQDCEKLDFKPAD
jgi:hypothetical protein